MLRTLYVIAIGLLFAAFAGFGVATFYPAPESPWKNEVTAPEKTAEKTDQELKEQAEQDRLTSAQYAKDSEAYQRNLSIIFLAISVLVIIASLIGLGRVDVIGDGITFGGVLLLFTGIVSSFGTNDEVFRFVAVSVGLAIVLILSWWKFVRPAGSNSAN